jgi:hypothetical protein
MHYLPHASLIASLANMERDWTEHPTRGSHQQERDAEDTSNHDVKAQFEAI